MYIYYFGRSGYFGRNITIIFALSINSITFRTRRRRRAGILLLAIFYNTIFNKRPVLFVYLYLQYYII